MASDTNTKNTKKTSQRTFQPTRARWFRLAPATPQVGNIFDYYWSGPERRITGLTIRIIAVNVVALIILLVGIVYVGQYQNSLVEARLQTFQTELELIASALSEQDNPDEIGQFVPLDKENTEDLVKRLADVTLQRIRIVTPNGTVMVDSRAMPGLDDRIWAERFYAQNTQTSLETLIVLVRFLTSFLPEQQRLQMYPKEVDIDNKVRNFPDIQNALGEGVISMSVWEDKHERIVLSAASPITRNGNIAGAVLLTRQGLQIEADIKDLWINVIRVFLGTLVLTVLLSIYLSGVIARPLKKLAKAAEAVRRGQAKADEIPDLSSRHDEIGELSTVLRQMTQALWSRMDSIEQFAADVSHELKNPLTSLKSAVETVQIVKKKADREKLLGVIQHDVERLDRLITDISHASRIDTELSREQFEKIDIKALLANVLDIYVANPLERDTAENALPKTVQSENATITLDTSVKKTVLIWGIEGQLAQVFQNILANALTFAPNGSEILVFVRTKQSKIWITIEDQGPGIPENKLDTIFERFYSERPQYEDYGQHSGLGLAICKQIIEAHAGRIFAENMRDDNGQIAGARFTVVLEKAS
ncbi:MAG: sensor N-terminal transmembrane domain-containing protein [Alphaproteobacteria bacterium]|nr:sensor N-terminal transmembrane domain-containing protein [Alphaproteobacteria bacterium]